MGRAALLRRGAPYCTYFGTPGAETRDIGTCRRGRARDVKGMIGFGGVWLKLPIRVVISSFSSVHAHRNLVHHGQPTPGTTEGIEYQARLWLARSTCTGFIVLRQSTAGLLVRFEPGLFQIIDAGPKKRKGTTHPKRGVEPSFLQRLPQIHEGTVSQSFLLFSGSVHGLTKFQGVDIWKFMGPSSRRLSETVFGNPSRDFTLVDNPDAPIERQAGYSYPQSVGRGVGLLVLFEGVFGTAAVPHSKERRGGDIWEEEERADWPRGSPYLLQIGAIGGVGKEFLSPCMPSEIRLSGFHDNPGVIVEITRTFHDSPGGAVDSLVLGMRSFGVS
ncbi:hypothetical protein C8R47DRAFT_1286396 [Mycena vitilis]|nr:hypothetical protein C8R47DRAFT_1286396 [Mycena vitilis]